MIVFKLKDPNATKETPIRMYCFLEKEKFYIYTRQKIHPGFWIKTSHRVTQELKVFRGGKQINIILDNLEEDANTLFREFKILGLKFTKEEFKNKFEEKAFGKIKNQNKIDHTHKSFTQHYTEYIENIEKTRGKSPSDNHHAALAMIQKYYKGKSELSFETIDAQFFTGLMNFIIYDEGLTINYAGTIGARLKTFMNLTFKEKLHKNIDFLHFKRMSEEVDTVALTAEEVDQLIKAPLIKWWDRARDIFIIQCLTGLRFSDTIILQKANIQGAFLESKSLKTDTPTIIPIHKEILKIVEKYDGFPPPMTNQRVNKYIKEAAKSAKLNREVIITTNIKGKTIKTKYELWELISTHTGRRTALTNMARQGIDLNDIRNISGHSSLLQLQTYLKIGNEETAKKLLVHPFFQGK